MRALDWRGLWTITLGTDPGVEFVDPYVASILFFTINASTGVVLRALSSIFLPASIRGLTLDFVSTMVACAYFFENNFVFKYYGSFWLGVAILLQCFVHSRTMAGTSENPIKALQPLMNKEISPARALLQIVVQSCAGIASYRFAKLVWSLDLISDHHERFYESTCASDLQVTLLMGFLIELCASLSDSWLNMQTVASNAILDEFVKYLNAVVMIIAGVTTTGMYFNPAMASGHTLGCKGTAMWEHFFVYWAGPFLGAFVALRLNERVHIDVVKSAEAKKSTEAKKSAEAKKSTEAKKSAEAKKSTEAKKSAEAKKSTEAKKSVDAKTKKVEARSESKKSK